MNLPEYSDAEVVQTCPPGTPFSNRPSTFVPPVSPQDGVSPATVITHLELRLAMFARNYRLLSPGLGGLLVPLLMNASTPGQVDVPIP